MPKAKGDDELKIGAAKKGKQYFAYRKNFVDVVPGVLKGEGRKGEL